MMKKIGLNKKMIAIGLAFLLSAGIMVGCGQTESPIIDSETVQESLAVPEAVNVEEKMSTEESALTAGGVLSLKVNPELAIHYDADGLVTKIEARNKDAKAIIEAAGKLEGKACDLAVEELVKVIGKAGYFVEEVEGEKRQITIEIEKGSVLPNAAFIENIVKVVQNSMAENSWNNALAVRGETDYGITNYDVTDYVDNVTDYKESDYNDPKTDYNDKNTDYNDPKTDYNDKNTDYNDPKTDYDDGNSPYGDSKYGDSAYDD